MKQWYRIFKPELAKTIRLAIPIVIAQLGVVLMGVILLPMRFFRLAGRIKTLATHELDYRQ